SGTGAPDSTLNSTLIPELQAACPANSDGNNTVPFDTKSRDLFDNQYFVNLVSGRGILQSDQSLFSSDSALSTTKSIVQLYSNNSTVFFSDFVSSMINMGNINPLTGSNGEIRKNCRV
ncbi:hypothetical protein Pfo_017715, partial [Paulownia fortunei]